jgi:hypothetical protein
VAFTDGQGTKWTSKGQPHRNPVVFSEQLPKIHVEARHFLTDSRIGIIGEKGKELLLRRPLPVLSGTAAVASTGQNRKTTRRHFIA